jgi:MFS family permease
MEKSKKWLVLMVLALGQGAVYFLPYIRNVYYTPLLEALNVNNAQFGSLVTYFAIGCMILYIPGGIMSDKWNYKKCIVYSLFSTSILVASFAFFLNFAYARMVFFLMAFTTTFVFWSATLKAVRLIAKADEQGKIFGSFYGIQGVLSIVIQSLLLFAFNQFNDQVAGLRFVLLVNAAINFIAGIGVAVLLEEPKEVDALQNAKQFEFKNVGLLIKNPLIWLTSIMVLCSYGLYSNSYFYTIYLTNVRGMDFNLGAQLSLIRVTYMMAIASFIGGIASDKLKSTTRWFAICAIGTAVTGFAFVVLMSSDVNLMIYGVISILPAAFMLLVYGTLGSLYEEYRIPVAYTGTAIGIVSIIGYTPDLFFGPLLGSWLDSQGDAGFVSIFVFFGVVALIGLGASVVAMYLNKRKVFEMQEVDKERQAQ